METVTQKHTSRERLHHIIDIVDDEKINAMLTLFQNLENGNEDDALDYSDELKAQLDEDYKAIQAGEKTYSKAEMLAHTDEFLKQLGVRK
jgi:hypothetical protein